MCLIVASQKGNIPKKDEVENAQYHNEDGFGIVWLERGKLHTAYNLKPDADVFAMFEAVKGKPYVAHFRYATHGPVNRENAHPFSVVKRTLYVAHNGMIRIDCPDKSKSDTWHFVESILRPCGFTATHPEGLKALGKLIGPGNKLAFLDISGQVSIVNAEQGSWSEDIWFSNTYSLKPPGMFFDDVPEVKTRLTFECGVECELCSSEVSALTEVESMFLCDKCVEEYEDFEDSDFDPITLEGDNYDLQTS